MYIFIFRKSLIPVILIFFPFFLMAQESDSLNSRQLAPVTIEGTAVRNRIDALEPISGTYIFDGKKTEKISVLNLDAQITEKNARQIFAKVPGIFVYDMDGAGNQINISARGLDPHRAWEFNVRKDGILINSDMYGYPAAHYSMPLEHVERIEIVRGTGALQYGAQFGGMINYISKSADTGKAIAFESYNTLGSYHLLSSYNSISGRIGKWTYKSYAANRSRDGYRDYEHSAYDAQGVMVQYQMNSKTLLNLDWSRSNYLYRMPGPLTDSMFLVNPRQSTRTRNYYSPEIQIPSLRLEWNPDGRRSLRFSASAVLGSRKSVLFDKPANVLDSIVAQTLQFNSRQVDIDGFKSLTTELRYLQQYAIFNRTAALTTGIQMMNNHLHRRQLGKGTTGMDYTLDLISAGFGRDLHLKTFNLAWFAEHHLLFHPRWSLNLGFRLEMGKSDMSGTITAYPENEIPRQLKRNFPLFGGSLQYQISNAMQLYAGISQVYRPVIFKDIIPTSTFEKVDPNIRDAGGYNAELGFKGKREGWQWEITGFLLRYNHRFGTLAFQDSVGNHYTYRSNIGNSVSAGIECFIQWEYQFTNRCRMSVFSSTALMEARYISGKIRNGNENFFIEGNKVESAPLLISRNGIQFQYRRWSSGLLYSYTGKTFADALNSEVASASGSTGPVPAYGILDWNSSLRISHRFEVKGSISNINNKSYFTKRPQLYPGPGIWPSDGINWSLSFIVKI